MNGNKNKFLLFCFKATLMLFGLITLFFILNIIITASPLYYYKKHIQKAFIHADLVPNHQDLIAKPGEGYDFFRGNHQYQDCLILMQGLKLSPNFLQNALNAPKYGLAKCESLETLALGDKKTTLKNTSFFNTGEKYHKYIKSLIPNEPTPYYQYLHGVRTLAVAMVSLMPLRTVRFLYQNIVYMLIFIIALYAALAKQFTKPRSIVFAMVFFIIFSFLHGVSLFGMNLSHGPGDMVTFGTGLLLFLFLKNEDKKSLFYVLVASGAFTAYFEYLVGIVPGVVCMIAIAVLLYHFASNLDFKDALKIFSVGTLCFFAGFLITYFTFIVVKILFTGYSWHMFLMNFGLRVSREVNQNPISYYAAIKHMCAELHWITGGNRGLSIVVSCLSFFGLLIVGILNLIKPKLIRYNNNYNTAIALALLPWIIVAAWYFVFKNHTIIHTWFMIRLVSFVWFSGLFITFSYITDIRLRNRFLK
ncbi:MAG: hypothetical protein PVG30_05955 [Gammaproteobacteria bacterium]|jgi:hypothetical protein